MGGRIKTKGIQMATITDDLGIANLALNHLSQPKIAAIDTTTETGRKVEACYNTVIGDALRDIKPNFAKKRAIFHHVVDAEKTITGATAANPVVITVATHGLSTDDIIAIWDVGGMTGLNGKLYKITVLTANTFSLADVNGNAINGEDFDAFTTGGKCGVASAEPAFGFTYRYALPSDYIAMMEINGNEEGGIPYAVEGAELLSNEAEMQARYIYRNTTVSQWDENFKMLASYKLAFVLANSITNLSALAERWENTYEKEKSKTKGQKSQEAGTGPSGPPRRPIINGWTGSRIS